MITRWILHCAYSGGLGGALFKLASTRFEQGSALTSLTFITTGASAGFILGLLQAILLRRYSLCGSCWILATALAAGLGCAVISFFGVLETKGIDDGSRHILSVAFGGGLIGLFVGALQWNTARTAFRAGPWLIANSTAGVVGMVLTFIYMDLMPVVFSLSASGAAGIMIGLFTGSVLGIITAPSLPKIYM